MGVCLLADSGCNQRVFSNSDPGLHMFYIGFACCRHMVSAVFSIL